MFSMFYYTLPDLDTIGANEVTAVLVCHVSIPQLRKSKHNMCGSGLATVTTQRFQLESPPLVVVVPFFNQKLTVQVLSLKNYLAQPVTIINKRSLHKI